MQNPHSETQVEISPDVQDAVESSAQAEVIPVDQDLYAAEDYSESTRNQLAASVVADAQREQREVEVVPVVEVFQSSNHTQTPTQNMMSDEESGVRNSYEAVSHSVAAETTIYQSTELNPFEILAHPVADLSGEWTPEKWEFWLRERVLVGKLFGGVLSLGQHGLMRGIIGGAVEFVIAAEHRVLTAEMRHGLLEALLEDWPQTVLEIVNVAPNEITPVQRKELRIKQAQIRAHELLVADPAIAPLITEFDGEVIELTMKDGAVG